MIQPKRRSFSPAMLLVPTFLPFLTYLASRDGKISVCTFHLAFVALSNCASPRIVSTSWKKEERKREGDHVVF